MGILEISFYGPFVYLLHKDPIEIYAPICPQHKAGIFTSVDEFAMPGRAHMGSSYMYMLASKAIHPGCATIDNPGDVFDASSAGAKLTSNPDAPYFCLTVPKPRNIFGMNLAPVEIVPPGQAPKFELKKRATALRFYYECDFGSPVTVTPPWIDNDQNNWILGFHRPHNAAHADIMVRYAASSTDDMDHEDAKDCFCRAASLLDLKHWLSYDQKSGGAKIRAGNDCYAPIVVMT